MYTTFSVVESIPPLTSRRRRRQFRSVRPSRRRFVHVQTSSSSREATYVHAQFTTHEEHPSSRPTHLTLRPYRSTDFVQYLSQKTAEILAPPFAQHTPRESDIRFSDHQVILQYFFSQRVCFNVGSPRRIYNLNESVTRC